MVINNSILIAVIIGVLPVLVWLWFWLKEDNKHPEPKGLLVLTFILGALGVVIVLPLEKLAQGLITNQTQLLITWAALEEIIKYLAVAAIALNSKHIEEPIDYVIYFITAALGFAALENVLFLTNSTNLGESAVSLLTGNLRFLGATLLHTVASGMIGVAYGLAYQKGRAIMRIYGTAGILIAISLHSVFNFFIMRNDGEDFLRIFGFLWVITIIFILILEKLRRIGPYYQLIKK